MALLTCEPNGAGALQQWTDNGPWSDLKSTQPDAAHAQHNGSSLKGCGVTLNVPPYVVGSQTNFRAIAACAKNASDVSYTLGVYIGGWINWTSGTINTFTYADKTHDYASPTEAHLSSMEICQRIDDTDYILMSRLYGQLTADLPATGGASFLLSLAGPLVGTLLSLEQFAAMMDSIRHKVDCSAEEIVKAWDWYKAYRFPTYIDMKGGSDASRVLLPA